MKRILIITALAVASCTAATSVTGEGDVGRNGITVNVRGPSSRATGVTAGDEAKINSLQVLVFDSDGKIDAVGYGNGTSLSVNVTAGKARRLWAVANAPDLGDVGSEDELCGRMSLLTDNSQGSFVMCGNTVRDIAGETEIDIGLVRLVARLSVEKITRRFDVAGLAARPLVIKGIYLINVAADLRYDGADGVSAWLNRRGFESGGADALLSERPLSISLDNGQSHSALHSFYCYPNPCTDDSVSGSWTPRKTRLVLEAELGGKTCYYSVTFPEIRRNRTYTIEELTLSGKGSSTPDTPYGRESLSASVTVRDWTDGSTYTENL